MLQILPYSTTPTTILTHQTLIHIHQIPSISIQRQVFSIPIWKSSSGVHQFGVLMLKTSSFLPHSFKRNVRVRVSCSGRETPYDVLGVESNASVDDIKSAYRKLALKFHPDVNKEANAQEKFMRIKHAYNTLLNSGSRTSYNSAKRDSDFSYSSAGRSWNTQQEEEFYGFGDFLMDVQVTLGDFFRDLQEEFRNWEAIASSQGKPKTLWEELAEIGEEFVEFLEKELNITDEDIELEGSTKDSYEGNSGSWSGGSGRGENNEERNNIKDSIDEVEAALSQLKKELGL